MGTIVSQTGPSLSSTMPLELAPRRFQNQLITLYGADRNVLIPPAGKPGLGTGYFNGLQFSAANLVIIMDADLVHHVSSHYDGKCLQKLTSI